MNGIKPLILVIFVCLCSTFCFSQKKDTTKTAEVEIYKDACKLLDSTKYKDAITLFKKALKIKPDYTEAYNKMALAKLKTQDYKGAEKDLQAAQK